MTVKELIEQLSGADQEATVYLSIVNQISDLIDPEELIEIETYKLAGLIEHAGDIVICSVRA